VPDQELHARSEKILRGDGTVAREVGDIFGVKSDAESAAGDGTVIALLKRLRTALAPATAADDLANPTSPQVLSHQHGYDGTVWRRLRTTASGGLVVDTELPAAVVVTDDMTSPTAPQVLAHLMAFDGVTWDRVATVNRVGDAAATGILAVGGFAYNGTNFDRVRANTEGTLLASAARTASISSADQTNHNASGVLITLNVTAVSGSAGVVLRISGKDPVSGSYHNLNAAIASITTVGLRTYYIYPGIAALNNGATQPVNAILPRTWRVTVTHDNADSITYSVGFALIL